MNIAKKIFVATICAGAVMLSCAKKDATTADGDGAFLDSRDGQRYRVVTIGNLTWMAQNLNFEADGSKCYDDDPKNCEKFGRLYSWDAARLACPAGWRLPNNDDWNALVNTAGNDRNLVGGKLKSQTGWTNGVGGTDDFGFAGLPGGAGDGDRFYHIGEFGYWWDATVHESSNEYETFYRYFSWRVNSQGSEIEYESEKGTMFSVRCVQDASEQSETETQGDTDSEFAQFIPSGYIILSDTTADFTNNGIEDRVFLVASRNDESRRDGIIITFCFEFQGCEVRFQNLNLFGQCEGAETQLCNVSVVRNNLKLAHESDESRKSWTFRINSNMDDFDLIGYDEEFFGSDGFVTSSISVNHLTKRKLTRTMTNAEDFYSDNFRPRYDEKWEDVIVDNLIRLTELDDLTNVTGYRPAPVQITAGRHTFGAVTIANTMWMVHNLNIDIEGARCYGDNLANCAYYTCGRLYQWETAYNLCANLGDGWRLPNDADWTELIEIGGLNDPNIFGFEVSYCGENLAGNFSDFNVRGFWWSATEISGATARFTYLVRENGNTGSETRNKQEYVSARCVKDLYND